MYCLLDRRFLEMGRLKRSMYAAVRRGWVAFNGNEYFVTPEGIAAISAKTGLVWCRHERKWLRPSSSTPTQDEDENRYVNEGTEAGRIGLDRHQNPYLPGDPRELEWNYGWHYYPGLRAIKQGELAKQAGLPQEANPYSADKDGDIFGAWDLGWSNDDGKRVPCSRYNRAPDA